MTIDTTLRKRHRTYFNHLAKCPKVEERTDDAIEREHQRNDERILTIIRKHLTQFNLQNHEVHVGYRLVWVIRGGRKRTYSEWTWPFNPTHNTARQHVEVIQSVLNATEYLKAHDNEMSRVA